MNLLIVNYNCYFYYSLIKINYSINNCKKEVTTEEVTCNQNMQENV